MEQHRNDGVAVNALNATDWNRALSSKWKEVSAEEKLQWRQKAMEQKKKPENLRRVAHRSEKRADSTKATAFEESKKRRVELVSSARHTYAEKFHALSKRTKCDVLFLIRSEDGNESCFSTEYYKTYEQLLSDMAGLPRSAKHSDNGGRPKPPHLNRPGVDYEEVTTLITTIVSLLKGATPSDLNVADSTEPGDNDSELGSEPVHTQAEVLDPLQNGGQTSVGTGGTVTYPVLLMPAIPSIQSDLLSISAPPSVICDGDDISTTTLVAAAVNPGPASEEDSADSWESDEIDRVRTIVDQDTDVVIDVTIYGTAEIVTDVVGCQQKVSSDFQQIVKSLTRRALLSDTVADLLLDSSTGDVIQEMEHKRYPNNDPSVTITLMEKDKLTCSSNHHGEKHITLSRIDKDDSMPRVQSLCEAMQSIRRANKDVADSFIFTRSDDSGALYNSQQVRIWDSLTQLRHWTAAMGKHIEWAKTVGGKISGSSTQAFPSELLTFVQQLSIDNTTANMQMEAVIDTLLDSQPDDVVVGNIRITNVCTIMSNGYLDDVIIYHFIKLFVRGIRGVAAIGPLLMARLLSLEECHQITSTFQRYFFSVFDAATINHAVAIVHRPDRNHWVYVRIDLTSRITPQVILYDSLFRKSEPELVSRLSNLAISLHWIRHKRRLTQQQQTTMLTFVSAPVQSKSSGDCGVFVLLYLFHDIRNLKMNGWSQSSIRSIRYLLLRQLMSIESNNNMEMD
eukprot:GILK01015456.1.p1 GENE.GILK01015456.1~~GILK01015456.1.p1  ORF type:complete len:743 (+),score=48.65 GILK01015456.1:25-2229(+)